MVKSRHGARDHDHEARRLHVAAFAQDGAALSASVPLPEFERLLDGWPAEAPPPDGNVEWSARGELQAVAAGEPQVWLHLHVNACVWRTCQRCLQPLPIVLQVDRRLRFVAGEDAAAALDAESDDDVLELVPALDLQTLIEDELLLALPLVPRHPDCAMPSIAQQAGDAAADEANPFAALSALKRETPPAH